MDLRSPGAAAAASRPASHGRCITNVLAEGWSKKSLAASRFPSVGRAGAADPQVPPAAIAVMLRALPLAEPDPKRGFSEQDAAAAISAGRMSTVVLCASKLGKDDE